MKRLVLITTLVTLGLGATNASAQLDRTIPSIVFNKKNETIPKDISNFAVISMNLNGIRAQYMLNDSNAPIVMPIGADYEIEIYVLNAETEHIKWVPLRQSTSSEGARVKEEKIRNDGGRNKTRQVVAGIGFYELGVVNYGNKQRGFFGQLDLSSAKPGMNGIIIRAENKKYDQIEALFAQLFTQARRWALGDGIPINLVDPNTYGSKEDLYAALVENGWVLEHQGLQRGFNVLNGQGALPSEIAKRNQPNSSRTSQHQCNDRCPQPCDRLGGQGGGNENDQGRGETVRDDDSSKRSSKSQVVLTSAVDMSYNGGVVNDQDTVRFENGKILTIKSKDGQPFDIAFIQILPDGSEKTSIVRKQRTSTKLTLDLVRESYRVEVTRNSRMIAMIMLEAK